MRSRPTDTVKVILHKRTERAILVSTDGEKESAVWFPLSHVEFDDDAEPGDGEFHDLIAPIWLIEDKGLA